MAKPIIYFGPNISGWPASSYEKRELFINGAVANTLVSDMETSELDTAVELLEELNKLDAIEYRGKKDAI